MEVVAAKVAAGHPLRDRLRFVEVSSGLSERVERGLGNGGLRMVHIVEFKEGLISSSFGMVRIIEFKDGSHR